MHASGSPKVRHASSAKPRCCGDNSGASVQWGIHCCGEYNELQSVRKTENWAQSRVCKVKRSGVTLGARNPTTGGPGKRPNDAMQIGNEDVTAANRSNKLLAATTSTESHARKVV